MGEIACPSILKSPNSSRASLVRYSLYKLNRISNQQHPCLALLPFFLFPLSLISHESMPVSFRICISLVYLISSFIPRSFSLLNPNRCSPLFFPPSLPSSKYPGYFVCCMCDEADCAMVAEFCSVWLLL